MDKDHPASWTRTTLAAKAGVGTETLRFYEQKGLLPEPHRNASGYRVYGPDDLTRLQFIRRAQELGFSLHDVAELLQLTGSIRTPRRKVRLFANERLIQIREKIRDLQAMERVLGGLVQRCDGKGVLQGCPIVDFLGGEAPDPTACCHE